MFKDYDKAKWIVKGSYEYLMGLMEQRNVSYDEIKDVMVEALYMLSKEKEKEKEVVHHVTTPQVVYGPPQMTTVEVHEVTMPQVLYGPPQSYNEELDSLFEPKDPIDPNTGLRLPRKRKKGESDESYFSYLAEFNANNAKARR